MVESGVFGTVCFVLCAVCCVLCAAMPRYRRRVFVAGKDLLMSTARCAWAILWMMCILVKQVFVYVVGRTTLPWESTAK